jgi:hypothetical protein
MSNVLDDTTQQQILALGRLGWSLRRIEQALAVRRETVSGYLKAAGIAVHGRGRRSESKAKPAISEEVSTDLGAKPAITGQGVSTDSVRPPPPGRAPSASACEPYRELIAEALGRGLETIEAAQAYLDRWELHWADTRIHGTTKRQVAAMFAEERPALGPLPIEPFRYYRFGERTVHLNGCVEVEGAYYGAPPGWLGQRVQVQWNELHVRLLAPTTGQFLRHLRTRRGWYQIHEEDRPARTPPTTLALLARATSAGPHIGTVCTQIHQHDNSPSIALIDRKTGEAHMLLEEIADATLDGTRKGYLADLAAVPLLIIDDLGMRKLPHTAAEDRLDSAARASVDPPETSASDRGATASMTG